MHRPLLPRAEGFVNEANSGLSTTRLAASREETMRKTVWLVLLALSLTGCGGGAPDSASEAAGPDLSGLSLEVHQAPD
jgi:hypothetical protein